VIKLLLVKYLSTPISVFSTVFDWHFFYFFSSYVMTCFYSFNIPV